MAITNGNQTFVNPTPGATSYTISSHNQDTGSNGYMIVSVLSTSLFGVTINGVTWNGVSMTELQQATITSSSGRLGLFELEVPATGVNDLVITWSSSQLYPVSIAIYSFTGAQSGGNSEINQADATPTEPTFTISNNSKVIGISYSNFATTSIELPQGTSRSILYTHSPFGGSTVAALSPALSSGTDTYEVNTTSGNASLSLIEIGDGGGGPTGKNEGSWWLMFN